MRFELPEGTHLEYRHDDLTRSLPSTYYHREGGLPITHLTIAVLVDDATGDHLAAGQARCTSLDQFSRKRGRDIAGGRALKNYHLSRGDA